MEKDRYLLSSLNNARCLLDICQEWTKPVYFAVCTHWRRTDMSKSFRKRVIGWG